MDSITIYFVYLSMVDSHPKLIISSWAITWTGGNSRSKRYVFSSLTRLNTPKTFSFFEEIMNVQVLIGSTDFTTNV